MNRALPLIGLLALALAAPAVGAPTVPSAAITGFPPYTLGTQVRAVLRADPELASGNYPVWTNDLLTQKYGRSIIASIGGVNYIALLGLQFWRGRLAAVVLKWPAREFDSRVTWGLAAENVHHKILSTYPLEAVKEHVVTSPSVWEINLADAAGNALLAWSIDRPLDITIAYLWAPYVKALEPAPGSEDGY